jgi:hypothetical protein
MTPDKVQYQGSSQPVFEHLVAWELYVSVSQLICSRCNPRIVQPEWDNETLNESIRNVWVPQRGDKLPNADFIYGVRLNCVVGAWQSHPPSCSCCQSGWSRWKHCKYRIGRTMIGYLIYAAMPLLLAFFARMFRAVFFRPPASVCVSRDNMGEYANGHLVLQRYFA